jgi:hypothetical protein
MVRSRAGAMGDEGIEQIVRRLRDLLDGARESDLVSPRRRREAR